VFLVEVPEGYAASELETTEPSLPSAEVEIEEVDVALVADADLAVEPEAPETEAPAEPWVDVSEAEVPVEPRTDTPEAEATAEPRADVSEAEAPAEPRTDTPEAEATAEPRADVSEAEAPAESPRRDPVAPEGSTGPAAPAEPPQAEPTSEPAPPIESPSPTQESGYVDLSRFANEALADPSSDVPPPSPSAARPGSAGRDRFGRRDPHERARHLARVLVSDIIAYYPVRYQEALSRGSLKEDFDNEIKKSWREYVDQVGSEMAESTPYFTEALNEVLARGAQIF
jgi:hypothetical protein